MPYHIKKLHWARALPDISPQIDADSTLLNAVVNKVKDLIDEYMNCSREESPEEHNQVEVKVAFLELP